MNPLRFGTQIKFVPLEVLDKNFPDDRELLSEDNLQIEDRVKLKPTGYAQGAKNCSIVAIHNQKETTVAHLIPDSLSWPKRRKIRKTLQKDIAQLRKNSEQPLHMVITGGRSFENPKTKASKKLLNLLKKIGESEKIQNVSIIWGLTDLYFNNGSGTSLFCNPEKDEVLIANPRIPNNMPEIENAFKIISIAQKDSFEAIPSEDD